MSDQEALKGAGAPAIFPESPIETQDAPYEKPRTPKRRTTPIYDDYQTAVSMIRSGTPGLPLAVTPGFEKTASIPVGDNVNVLKTPSRRLSYSMTDVHQKLADSYNDLQKAFPARAKQPTTVQASAGQRRVSAPNFPLKGRDSDDENERLIALGQYTTTEDRDNPAGINLDDLDVPLRDFRDIELAQVPSRTRGDPVLSQEINASSADFGYAGDTSVGVPRGRLSSSNRGSENAPTDTSTVGRIVDQYGSVFVEDTCNHFSNDTQARDRAHAGPPPSWPLPTPPTLPPHSAKRHESSGIVSTPGAYGNTSALLNTTDTSSANITCPGIHVPASPCTTKLKHSTSVDNLVSGQDRYYGNSSYRDGNEVDHTRLSHVSEESSGRPSIESGWMPAVGYVGRPPRNEDAHLLEFGAHVYGAAESDDTAGDLTSGRAGWSPGHRRTENIFYPSGLSTGKVRRSGVMDLSPTKRFRSLDKILAGPNDTDSDTIDVVDDGDWETIHESQSINNLKEKDISDEAISEFANLPSVDSLSLKKAPVSAWDPISTKTPGYDQSENFQEMTKLKKEITTNNKAQEMGKAGAKIIKMPHQNVQAHKALQTDHAHKAGSLPGPGYRIDDNPEGSVLSVPKLSQANKSKPSSNIRYRHPAPLDPLHNNPFATGQPTLRPLAKKPSTSSTGTTDDMFALRNLNIESTSSLAGNSINTASVESREEHNRRVLAEANRYDPGESTFYFIVCCQLTLLQTAHISAKNSQMPASPSTSVSV